MGIRRRATFGQEAGHRLRHRLLRHGTTSLLVYRFVKQNPGCTFKQIKQITASGQPVTNLVNEGLLRTEGDSKQSYRYFAVPEHEIGPGRDILDVELRVFVNQFGEYSIVHILKGEQPRAAMDFPRQLITKRLKISVPSPKEPYASRDIEDADIVEVVPTPSDTKVEEVQGTLIIDGDYDIIE